VFPPGFVRFYPWDSESEMIGGTRHVVQSFRSSPTFQIFTFLQTMLSSRYLSGAAQNTLRRSQVCIRVESACVHADYQRRPSEATQLLGRLPPSLLRRVPMSVTSMLASEPITDGLSGQLHRHAHSRRWYATYLFPCASQCAEVTRTQVLVQKSANPLRISTPPPKYAPPSARFSRLTTFR